MVKLKRHSVGAELAREDGSKAVRISDREPQQPAGGVGQTYGALRATTGVGGWTMTW